MLTKILDGPFQSADETHGTNDRPSNSKDTLAVHSLRTYHDTSKSWRDGV